MEKLSPQYIAGLFDGEGCVHINKNFWTQKHVNPVYQLMCSINMVDKEPLIILKEMFGGCLGINKRKKPTHRDCTHWIIASRKAYYFLRQIYPYTIIKKEQIEVAFKFQEHIFECGRHVWKRNKPISQTIIDIRESFYLTLKQLKRKI